MYAAEMVLALLSSSSLRGDLALFQPEPFTRPHLPSSVFIPPSPPVPFPLFINELNPENICVAEAMLSFYGATSFSRAPDISSDPMHLGEVIALIPADGK